ncbi:Transmembrane protein [Orchesella cincta]|uniref:Transmembrane protein n=1 Tax=Orchesella cincta TaxID=48709 RepID=A0A1D2MCZ0_ORCCI|nr:Transmembrane protein [Orchesella cincta]
MDSQLSGCSWWDRLYAKQVMRAFITFTVQSADFKKHSSLTCLKITALGRQSSLLGVGLLFGSILAFGAYQTSQDPSNYWVSLGASVILAGLMGTRYYHSGKFMPAGLIA